MLMIPEDLLYFEEHEWVRTENTTATIGISDYAQNALGDIVYVDLPKVGDEVSMGDTVGEIESVKSTSELRTPVSGKVLEVNESIVDTPEIINEDPYGSGWLFKVEMTDPTELDELMNAEEYEAYIKEL
ncbi:MAG: glycine cleavage system protein GcvH [Actinomycetota bacterium]|nr:glycine cleavage system protein GcvH [Actinomycetota bacterium]